MNRLLLLFLFITSSLVSQSQAGYLFVKHGYKKKKTYLEGDRVMLQLRDGYIVNGLITLLRNDSIWMNGTPVPRKEVAAILLPRKKNPFPADAKTLLLIGAGSGLVTAGLTINDRETFRNALIAGLVIGYGPLLVKYLGKGFLLSLQRKRYIIGRKYRLQVLDFHIPNKRAF